MDTALALAPFALIALAIVLDVRTRRGYGLGILSFLLLALTTLVYFLTTTAIQQRDQMEQQHIISRCGGCILSFLYFFPALFATLAILIAAAVVASIAGRWGWLVGLVIAALVPWLATMLPPSFWGAFSDPATQQMGPTNIFFDPVGTALLAIPQVAVLAYSIARIFHPAAPARIPQSAPPS